MDEMLTGHSEALTRAKAWTGQHMADKNEMCYPTATNNRGAHGRENHAGGDMVGNSAMPSQGGAHQNSRYGHGGSDMPSQGGAHMGNMQGPRSHGGRESHAYGDMVGPQNNVMQSQQQPPQQMPPQQYRNGGGVEREAHGFGSMVSGAFKSAKKAATPLANQAKGYAQGQAKNLASAGKQYASQQGKALASAGKQYASQQLGAGSKALAEPHSWGSFVRGAKKDFGTAGRNINSAAKATGRALAPAGRAISSGAKTAGHAIASGANTAGRAISSTAKQAAGQMARGAGQSAMMAGMAAKRGGSIHDEHMERKESRRERRGYDD